MPDQGQGTDGLRLTVVRRKTPYPFREWTSWQVPTWAVPVEHRASEDWQVVEVMPVSEHQAQLGRALNWRADEIEPYEKANTGQKHRIRELEAALARSEERVEQLRQWIDTEGRNCPSYTTVDRLLASLDAGEPDETAGDLSEVEQLADRDEAVTRAEKAEGELDEERVLRKRDNDEWARTHAEAVAALRKVEEAEGEVERLGREVAQGRALVETANRLIRERNDARAETKALLDALHDPSDELLDAWYSVALTKDSRRRLLTRLADALVEPGHAQGDDGRQAAIDEVVNAWRSSEYVGGPSERDCARLTTERLEPFATPDPQGMDPQRAAEREESQNA